MTPRAAAAAAFLAGAGWSAAQVAPLAGDASPRRYFRLSGGPGGAGAVLMDADPALGESVRPFAALTGWLREAGLSAPDILAADPGGGFLLLEDLGDALFTRVCAGDAAAEGDLYAAAVDVLARLHAAPPPARAAGWGCESTLAPYDAATLGREARLAVEWWAPAAGRALPPDAAAEFDALVRAACAAVASDRRALVLRDYHADNLIWLPGRAGAARVGLLDYQDALIGAPEYDLISLLEDARRDTSPGLRAAMRARYAGLRGAGFDAGAFDVACAALAAQRNLKIVGIFARLARRDGKPGYLGLIPRVWDHLRRDLAHPELRALRAFVERWIPPPGAATLARAAEAVA